MMFPLSAALTYSLTSPVMLRLSVLKIALTDALPAERYWQSLHQQARVTTGSWSNWNRTAPQKHRPVIGFAILNTFPFVAEAKSRRCWLVLEEKCPFAAQSGGDEDPELLVHVRRRGREAMRTFVALMRGINVGSRRRLPMADLRALCLGLGLRRPETYIQSGNLIVDAGGGADDVRGLLEGELTARFGFTVDVVVRTAADWEQYVAANPFAGDPDALPKMVHLYLPRDRLEPGAAEALEQRARMGERIVLAGGALWIDYGAAGVHGSKLSPLLIDKACGSPTTGRNWNSVLRIREMIEARG